MMSSEDYYQYLNEEDQDALSRFSTTETPAPTYSSGQERDASSGDYQFSEDLSASNAGMAEAHYYEQAGKYGGGEYTYTSGTSGEGGATSGTGGEQPPAYEDHTTGGHETEGYEMSSMEYQSSTTSTAGGNSSSGEASGGGEDNYCEQCGECIGNNLKCIGCGLVVGALGLTTGIVYGVCLH
ncbi:hypothetical protein IAT38_006850 [Cryptococcus sp. DSM 104549]